MCPQLLSYRGRKERLMRHHPVFLSCRVAPRSHREPWRQTQVTSPQKVRAAVAAAAAAEAAASGGGDPLPNPMHLPHGDGAGTVFGAAAVPASSASHAAAGAAAGEAGAGRAAGAAVAAAAEEGDTQVIDVVDPGRWELPLGRAGWEGSPCRALPCCPRQSDPRQKRAGAACRCSTSKLNLGAS